MINTLNHLLTTVKQLSAEEHRNPRAVLDIHFKSLAPLPVWKRYLKQWLKAMFAPTFQWVGRGPGETVFIGECFQRLIEAAWLIHILKLKTDCEGSQRFQGNYINGEFYPLTLEKEEIGDPYLVLEAFFDFRAPEVWTEDIEEWLNIALSNRSIAEYSRLWELIISYEHLEKLLEATYLIWVREL